MILYQPDQAAHDPNYEPGRRYRLVDGTGFEASVDPRYLRRPVLPAIGWIEVSIDGGPWELHEPR